MNSGDSSSEWAGALGAWDAATPRPAVPTLREAEAAGNTSDVVVDQQQLGESACGVSLPDVLLPDAPLPEVLPDR